MEPVPLKLKTMRIIPLITALCLYAGLSWAATLYISPDGNDKNTGTKDKPFATLERARDQIRQLRTRGQFPSGAISVELRSGIYELLKPFELTAEDSGTEKSPVIYQSSKGETVRIIGGRVVTGWKQIADTAILNRLDETARSHLWNLDISATSHVWQADLKALGINDLDGIGKAVTYQSDPGLELFFQDIPMTLSRYPNDGWILIADVPQSGDKLINKGLDREMGKVPIPSGRHYGRFTYEGNRPNRWSKMDDIWMHGFWVWDWADSYQKIKSIDKETNTIYPAEPYHGYGYKKGQWFYFLNILEELDSPGEWFLDRDTSILYFWPPTPLMSGKAVVSVVRDLFRFTDVSNVTLRGLVIEDGRGSAVVIKGGANIRVVACTIRNMGNWGVRVTGGVHHGVVGCDIYQNGQGGIHLEGGDRKTLTPAGHYADNNYIHHLSRWDPVYQQASALFGVGNSATHNLISDVPHIAIGFSGNDQTIEYNEIKNSVYQSNDAGAIYTSPPDETWSMRGHKIRYNYLHNICGFKNKGCFGVYLDDCFSSADISGNIFYNVATPILIGGGRDNIMTNNMFINCGKAFSIDARGLGWAQGVGSFATKELIDLNYKQPPWSTKYPELLTILEDEPLAPKGNVMARNICWGGVWGATEEKAKPYVKFEDNLDNIDPLFEGKPDPLYAWKPLSDYRLAPGSPALKRGFIQIPFGKIGVYQSSDRASWPVEQR